MIIEGVYAAPGESLITDANSVDAPGVRVGVERGSAYDLFLTRTLTQAEVVRGVEGVTIFREAGLEIAAGIRQPLTRYVAGHTDVHLLEPSFMEIRQAVTIRGDRSAAAHAFLNEAVEEVKRSRRIETSLTASGQEATVAPAAVGSLGVSF